MHRRRELIFGREPILNRQRHIPARGKLLAPRIPATTVAGAKSSAVNANNRRQRSDRILRPRHVELQMLVVGIGELDIRLKDDLAAQCARHDPEHDQESQNARFHAAPSL